MFSKKWMVLIALVAIAAMILPACAPPTPEVVVKEVPVEKKVVETVVVEKEVPVEKEVVKEVEVVVTATPVPPKAVEFANMTPEEQQKALDEGKITEAQWFDDHKEYFTKSYLAADNPCSQSGHGGDEARWRYAQGIILEAIHKSGTFLDVGCANGHLIESLNQWVLGSGCELEFYGLEISEGLVELARKRLRRA